MSKFVVVTRNGKTLSKNGKLPTLDDIESHIVIIHKRDFEDIAIVESSIGDPPDSNEWQWLKTAQIQSQLETDTAHKVGRALLCA